VDGLPVRAAPPGRATRLAVGLATIAPTLLFRLGRLGDVRGDTGGRNLQGATVDNMTGDPNMQIARPARPLCFAAAQQPNWSPP